MPTETMAVARWLYSVLSADDGIQSLVDGRIFGYRVPHSSGFPSILFQMQVAEADSRVIGSARVGSRLVYAVKAIGQGADFVAIQTIAGRIDALLEASSGSNIDGVIVSCVRDRPVEILESSDTGEDYVHLGGLYRLTVAGA